VLPQAVQRHAATVDSQGTVYVIAGYNTASLNTVYSGVVQANGNILSWTTETALPATLSYPAASAYGTTIYVSGGATDPANAGTSVATVYKSVPEINMSSIVMPITLLIGVVATSTWVRPNRRSFRS
jgi:N-acetylneuraminic acid mutarotase